MFYFTILTKLIKNAKTKTLKMHHNIIVKHEKKKSSILRFAKDYT